MLSLLQNILLDLNMIQSGQSMEFEKDEEYFCTVHFEKSTDEQGETISYYELGLKDQHGDFSYQYFNDSDILAMMIYTLIKEKQPVIN